MRVFIAEKPSLGKAIAAVLPGPQKRHKTYIESGPANVVVWCAGHILTQYMPEDYDASHKKWQMGHLPIIPNEWKMNVSPRTRDLYKTIKRYLAEATLVIHAGDPDREGQLLIDEVMEHIGVNVPVKRLLISDMNAQAVSRAMKKMEDNSKYHGLRDAAQGRARADWLYGLNLTRLYTLQGRDAGFEGVLSVGRVQTPVLGLVVRRDREIGDHKSKPFYTVTVDIEVGQGAFTAHWVPSERANPYQDPDGRVIDQAFAQSVADAITSSPGTVTHYKVGEKSTPPPLPFNLPELQKAAARGRGLSPRRTLDIAQSLYEKHQVLTYPRSDCRYLPADHWMAAAKVRDAIGSSIGNRHSLCSMADEVDLIVRGSCWNDSKVTAHHAIIPTTKWVPLDKLSPDERWVYETVAHRYLLQFCEPYRYQQVEAGVTLTTAAGDTEMAKARSRSELAPGWRQWESVLRTASADKSTEDEGEAPSLPAMVIEEPVKATGSELVTKHTTAPKPFTEATLLDAMTGIARYVQDPAIKKTLKETDGLGTPATQAGIIELLFKRQYLVKKGKTVTSTDLGRSLIDTLPEEVTLPDMTAQWEQHLARIAAGKSELPRFLDAVTSNVVDLTASSKAKTPMELPSSQLSKPSQKKKAPSTYPCTAQTCDGRLRRIKGKKGFFWGCTNYSSGCRETKPDSRGKPAKAKKVGKGSPQKIETPAIVGGDCPSCKAGKIQLRSIKSGKNAGKSFLGCSTFPKCRHFAWPAETADVETTT